MALTPAPPRQPFADTAFGKHLSAALQAHVTGDAQEEAYRKQMLGLVATADDPRHRGHFDPGHFTASAFIVSADGGSLLLILHGKLNRWLQPGGHIEAEDADVVAAAMREAREETGLTDLELVTAPFDLDIHTIPARKDEPDHLHLDVRVLLRARSGEAQAGDGVQACRWVPLHEVSTLESDASVLRAVARLRARQDRSVAG